MRKGMVFAVGMEEAKRSAHMQVGVRNKLKIRDCALRMEGYWSVSLRVGVRSTRKGMGFVVHMEEDQKVQACRWM